MIRALIGILAVSLSCAFAVASEPPTKAKPTAQPAVSAKRQAKLDAIHAKRKAASERKRNAVVNQDASASSLEASIRNTKEKVISHQAASAIKMQVDADNRQLQQQQPILTAEQALWNQERQVLLKELSGQAIIDGPNGGMLRGDGLPALQVPSFGGMQVPSYRWYASTFVRWSASTLVRWYASTFVRWSASALVRWATGTFIRWATSTIVRWATGTVVRWATGTVVRWAIR